MTKKQFKTKTSNKQAKFSTGMVRDVADDKPRFDLLIPLDQKYDDTILYRWAMLMNRGAQHYGERNWEKAKTQNELNRFKQSLFRHLIQYLCDYDDEDHASAILFNVMGAEYTKNQLIKKRKK